MLLRHVHEGASLESYLAKTSTMRIDVDLDAEHVLVAAQRTIVAADISALVVFDNIDDLPFLVAFEIAMMGICDSAAPVMADAPAYDSSHHYWGAVLFVHLLLMDMYYW